MMSTEAEIQESPMHYMGQGDNLFACAATWGAATTNADLVDCDACKKAAKIVGYVPPTEPEEGSE